MELHVLAMMVIVKGNEATSDGTRKHMKAHSMM
jgi:hypothetical protein